jgi:hypothetical protein
MVKISPRSKFNLLNMCTPATIYFVLSLISLILLGIGNLENSDKLCIGNYSCYVGNNTIVFVLNAIYILFWTFVLDLMCKAGYSSLSWIVLLLPFILIFLFLFMVMVNGKEGNQNKNIAGSPF